VNVNYPSSYSALAVSAILGHYGLSHVPVGLRRPFTNATFFDSWGYQLGEFTSKVAYNWRYDSCLPWGGAEEAWEPVKLYRKVLSEQENKSVTIASIGFLENVCISFSSSGSFAPFRLQGIAPPQDTNAAPLVPVICPPQFHFGLLFYAFGAGPGGGKSV